MGFGNRPKFHNPFCLMFNLSLKKRCVDGKISKTMNGATHSYNKLMLLDNKRANKFKNRDCKFAARNWTQTFELTGHSLQNLHLKLSYLPQSISVEVETNIVQRKQVIFLWMASAAAAATFLAGKISHHIWKY